MKTYMLTIKNSLKTKRLLKLLMKNYDVKKYIIAKEVGKDGYQHYQCRISGSGFNFDTLKFYFPDSHIEEAETENQDYERKEGRFWCDQDNNEIRKVRFGKLQEIQKKIMREVKKQSDREVDVFYDPFGNHGKSWLSIHLWETGRALVVPRSATTAEKLSAYICSAYKGEEFIIIDIPRASKPTNALYECIEEVKDGLVFDSRYYGKCRNIRGVKMIVFTNHELNLKALSKDRWKLHGIKKEGGGTS